MDQTLITAVLYDGIIIVLGLVVLGLFYSLFKAGIEYREALDLFDQAEEISGLPATSTGQAFVDRQRSRVISRSIALITSTVILFFYVNREGIWFRPEPAPKVDPERSIRVEEIMGKQIIVNEPVNVPERQKIDPAKLEVKERVEAMEDLDGGPEETKP